MNAAFLVAPRHGAGLRRPGEGDRAALRQADVQVHRPLAALQLREHPPEAGERRPALSGASECFILDTLLIGGIRFVLDKVAAAVDTELNDDTALREQLLAAQMRVELGEMTEEEFAVFEADILARLRDIRERRQGSAPAALSPADYKITGIEATFEGGRARPADRNSISSAAKGASARRPVPRRLPSRRARAGQRTLLSRPTPHRHSATHSNQPLGAVPPPREGRRQAATPPKSMPRKRWHAGSTRAAPRWRRSRSRHLARSG